jgi:hypothetical protein
MHWLSRRRRSVPSHCPGLTPSQRATLRDPNPVISMSARKPPVSAENEYCDSPSASSSNERFEMIFRRTVQQCVQAGLVRGDIVHFDATLIRADVSWDSIVERHLDEVKRVNDEGSNDDPPSKDDRNNSASRPVSRTKQVKKVSTTDPDATMATSSQRFHMEPSYKQHTAVNDKAGVIVDVHVTTGERSEGKELEDQLDRVERSTGRKIKTVTADAGYAHGTNYAMLETREVETVIPPQRPATRYASGVEPSTQRSRRRRSRRARS